MEISAYFILIHVVHILYKIINSFNHPFFFLTDLEVGENGLNITSPFYPIVGYPENFTFTWNLNATDGYQIALLFSLLSIDEYGGDALYIGEGSDGDIEDALYVFTGYRSSFRILPFADSIWMTLVSDGYDFGGRGFGAFAFLVNDTAAGKLCEDH